MHRLGQILAICVWAGSALASVTLLWGTSSSGKLKLNGTLTTPETFTHAYTLSLMYIGNAPAPYSEIRGYATFLHANAAKHSTSVNGVIQGTHSETGTTEINGMQLLMVLHEKATGKHYFISETQGGNSIAPYTFQGVFIDPITPLPTTLYYHPTSSTGYFYKGAEIPAFCGWLSKYNLTEDNLAGIPANRVNLAFAVNANPTNFSGIALAITDVSFSLASFSGAFTFNAKDTAGTPTAITTLRDPAALTIRTTDSLSTSFSPPPASSLSLETNTFEVNTTPTTQFLRLDFTPAKLW